MLPSVFYLFLFEMWCFVACREWCCIAVARGCYQTMFTFSDAREGNTTASLHTNRPSVSVASVSLKNIWLICRIRRFYHEEFKNHQKVLTYTQITIIKICLNCSLFPQYIYIIIIIPPGYRFIFSNILAHKRTKPISFFPLRSLRR